MSFTATLAGRRNALEARARILQDVRDFFISRGFLETETPFRIPAPAPESYIDAIPADGWFLHTSPELCMKRMLAAGYGSIFQICRCWRGGERGSLHLPEFTMLEWYRSGADYTAIMEDCEQLVRHLVQRMGNDGELRCRGSRIAVGGPWEMISVADAYLRYGETSMEDALAADRFDEIMVEKIEPNLGWKAPTFLCDYPAERGALARLKEGDHSLAERFEFYIAGLEIANAFTELVDVEEQRQRFAEEARTRASRGMHSYPSPEKFLRELAVMPPSAGIALGIDRLVMLLLDKEVIDEVVAFTPEEL